MQPLVVQVTIWLGVFPIVVSWWAALGLTIYFIATNAVLYYIKSLKHIEALWFANCANQLLFYTYIKVRSCWGDAGYEEIVVTTSGMDVSFLRLCHDYSFSSTEPSCCCRVLTH